MTAPTLADLERARDHAARVCAELAYIHGDPRAVERYAQEYRRYADQAEALTRPPTVPADPWEVLPCGHARGAVHDCQETT